MELGNSERKNVTLIVNPKAGKLISKQRADHIASLLKKKNYNVKVCYTKCKNHATELVKMNFLTSDIILCCGGDGTLNETVSGIMKCSSNTPIGYIPSGTTNDFAKTLGLCADTKKAVDTVTGGKTSRCDIGYIEETDRYFMYVTSFGAFTKTSYATSQKIKNKIGHAAYILGGIKSIKDIRPYKVKVTADGKTYKGNFVFGSVTNTTSIGGIVSLKKEDVKLNDGMFELILVRMPKNIFDLKEIALQLFNHKYDNENIIFTHAKKVQMQFEENVAFTTDGEFGGNYREINVVNKQKEFRIFTPRRKK